MIEEVAPEPEAPVDDPYGMISEDQVKRLRTALECSYRKLEPYREHRKNAITQMLGAHYSGSASKTKVPVNLLAMAVNIYCRQLAAKNPKVLCTTKHMALKPRAAQLELAGDHLLQEIEFQSTMRSLVLNALLGVGVAKIGITANAQVEIDGELHDSGQPFADSIDLDDIIFDMSATTFDEMSFIGNKYYLPLDVIKESGLYNPSVVEMLKPTKSGDQSDTLKADDGDVKKLGQGEPKEDDDYEDRVRLIDVYLPRKNLMVTLIDQDGIPPLNVVEWQGPENGPYRILGFQEVPNNIMPLPPVALWVDIHVLTNKVFNKLGQQAERQKTWTAVKRGADRDGKTVVDVNDGEAYAVDDPKNFAEIRNGGVEAPSLAFGLQLQDIFSRSAGNLDSLGGLSPQAETLGQEELLSQSASKSVAEMQDRTMECAKAIIRDLLWYLWHDPLISLPLTQRIAGEEIQIEFTPEDREGDFLEYNIDIQPYSMEEQTPAKKVMAMFQLWERVIMPGMPIAQAQGMMPNLEGFVRNIAKLTNVPEVEELITFANPQMPPAPPAGEPTQGKPAVTKRTYERVNRPGATDAGKQQIMATALMGGNPQPKEMASLTRPST